MESQLVEVDLADWAGAKPNDAWIAALEAGKVLYFPRLRFELLPSEAKPGDVLTLSLEPDPAATRKLAEETRRVQDKLSERDPGGDIKL